MRCACTAPAITQMRYCGLNSTGWRCWRRRECRSPPLRSRKMALVWYAARPHAPRQPAVLVAGQTHGRVAPALAFAGPARTALFQQIGAQMAQMHALADGWSLPAGFACPKWDAEGLVGDTPFWGLPWAIDASPEDTALLHAARARAQSALVSYVAEGADYGLIHADLVRENVLVDADRLHFIDFDDCGFGFRMFDIATTLLKNPRRTRCRGFAGRPFARLYHGPPAAPGGPCHAGSCSVLRSLTYLGWANSRPNDPGIQARAARFLATAKRVIAKPRAANA